MDAQAQSGGIGVAGRPATGGLTEAAARVAVAAAALAPSIHNTQPWRWRLRDGVLDLFADRTRQLGSADARGRQLLMSCGAALLQARLALRGEGLVVRTGLRPDDDQDHLARIEKVGAAAPSADELALLAALPERHTERRPFAARPVPADVVDVLRVAVEAEGGWLAPLDRGDLRLETAVLLSRADWLETEDPAYRAELLRWMRTGPGAVDGIPRSAVVGVDQPRQSEFPLRDFDVVGSAGHRIEPAVVEHPAAFALGTDGDGPVDCLRAGEALGRLLLTATAVGLVASPLGQVLDLGPYREQLRHAFSGVGHVQMLLRVGYPAAFNVPAGPTPRRSVEDVLSID